MAVEMLVVLQIIRLTERVNSVYQPTQIWDISIPPAAFVREAGDVWLQILD